MKIQRVAMAALLWLTGMFALSGHVDAREVTVITSSSTPPYVNPQDGTGVVLDIITRAFAAQGYTVHFLYAPNRRVVEELDAKRVDAAFNGAGAQHAYFSDPVINYHNVGISLTHNNFHIKVERDLSDKRVLAFQNATLLTTPAMAEMAHDNPHYTEVDNQASQVPMLYLGRTDVVIMEREIFAYYLKVEQAGKRIDVSAPYTIHNLFPPSARLMAFHDAGLRDDFNAGLKTIRQNGEYRKILAKYAIDLVN